MALCLYDIASSSLHQGASVPVLRQDTLYIAGPFFFSHRFQYVGNVRELGCLPQFQPPSKEVSVLVELEELFVL